MLGQEYRGTISGAVTDATGGTIAGAKITVTETRTNTRIEAATESTGQYTAPFLLPGDYDISARMDGFKEYVRKGIHVGAGEHPVIDIQLDIGDSMVTVEVKGQGANFPPCNYEIVPPQLDFGSVENNKSVQLSFYIRNPAGNPSDECLVSTLGLAHGTSSSFALVEGELAAAHVRGGEALEVPVRFAPAQDGTYSGAVEFYVSSINKSEGQVSLTGISQKGCLQITPSGVDIGAVEVDCRSPDSTVALVNSCSTDQVVQSIDVQPGLSQEFHIVQKPA